VRRDFVRQLEAENEELDRLLEKLRPPRSNGSDETR
jgi:hypothetical protein